MESSESSEEVALLRDECVLRAAGFLGAASSSLLSLSRAVRTAAVVVTCKRATVAAAFGTVTVALLTLSGALFDCFTAPFDGGAAASSMETQFFRLEYVH